MRLHRTHCSIALAIAATAALSACNDTAGVNLGLSAAEKAALSSALGTSNVLSGAGSAASYAGAGIAFVNSIGSLSAGAQSAVADGIRAAVRGSRAAAYDGAIVSRSSIPRVASRAPGRGCSAGRTSTPPCTR